MSLPTKFTLGNYQVPLAAYLQQIAGVSVRFPDPIDRESRDLESQIRGLEVTLTDRFADLDRILRDRAIDDAAQLDDWWEIASRAGDRDWVGMICVI
jgi:hypothetical protein